MNQKIATSERLIFALDVPSVGQARALVETLGDTVHFYKIGLELLASGSYFDLAEYLVAAGKKVFLDLKLFDVPRTVAAVVRNLQRFGDSFVTVHGNQGMLEAAVAEKGALRVLAVTALTSLDQNDLRDLGFQCDIQALVNARARAALEVGCDGVVSSGLEIEALRQAFGSKLLIITPGIRPLANRDDQKRTVNLEEAFRKGADYVVVGRPIRLAESPRAAAAAIQSQIAAIFNKHAPPARGSPLYL